MDTPRQKQSHQSQAGQGQSTIQSFSQEKPTESNAIKIPEKSLPKGGGAIKGIDEKFEVNAANWLKEFN